jgi:hypothetical protein
MLMLTEKEKWRAILQPLTQISAPWMVAPAPPDQLSLKGVSGQLQSAGRAWNG